VGVENLRKFVAKNKVKTSTFSHRSLSTEGHLNQIIVEITLMKARRDNGEPDPWLQGISKTIERRKKPAVNRYRLANVVVSEQLRPAVLHFGRALTKDDLETRVKNKSKAL
jgi:hypothetical protein